MKFFLVVGSGTHSVWGDPAKLQFASRLSYSSLGQHSQWSANCALESGVLDITMIVQSFRCLRLFRASISRPKWPSSTQLQMASTFPDLPIFRAISSHDPESTAIIHSKSNRRFTYGELLKDVEDAKIKLYGHLKSASPESIGGQRVAFLVENGYDYVGAHF